MDYKALIHSFARWCGYDFKRYTKENYHSLRRAHILRTNEIDLVLDVGAHVGTFAQELRETGYAGEIISFEPLSSSFAMLKRASKSDSHWRCLELAIGNRDGEALMNISSHSSSSSLLAIGRRHLEASPNSGYVGTQRVRVTRLDSVQNQLFQLEHRLYLKIDVQGLEKQVIEGAAKVLDQTFGIEVELSLVPLYEGAALYRELIDFLDHLNFDLVSLEDVFVDPHSGRLLQVDGMFVRRS